MWVLGVLCSSSDSAWFPEVIHERDWYYPSFLRPHTAMSRIEVKVNLKPTRLELPPLPAHGAHQASSAASGRSFIVSKAEEVKMVKEVLLLKSSSSPSSSSMTTTTIACGLGGSAVLYLVIGAYGYNIEHILMVDIILDQSVRKAMNEINAGFKFGCAAAVSDCLALLLTSSLQVKLKTDTFETPPTVNELYLHLHTVNHDMVTFIGTRSERFYELTQTTPDQPVDDEAVYYKVAGECPKGRVYGLWSLGRKKRRYADPNASTSQVQA
ncbi:hypothetical protein Scep_012555 [Stephania cephalantha]|uniref:Uncharacterized protein n=1 Tax=Stephania cephalantha TaxID=152367 RepID=A0AAP0P6K7_9MAGN